MGKEAAARPQPGSARREPRTVTGTVLLVDDEAHIRETGSEFLSQCGYLVRLASSGEEALETYRREGDSIDVVVLDLGMPGIGGHETLKSLLALNPEAKVIIASGYSVGDQVKKALELGATGFVGKPYRLSRLFEMIREVAR